MTIQSEHSSNPSRIKWIVRKVDCPCHRGKWMAWRHHQEHEFLLNHPVALAYATDPRFRARWKAGQDLAHAFPKETTA